MPRTNLQETVQWNAICSIHATRVDGAVESLENVNVIQALPERAAAFQSSQAVHWTATYAGRTGSLMTASTSATCSPHAQDTGDAEEVQENACATRDGEVLHAMCRIAQQDLLEARAISSGMGRAIQCAKKEFRIAISADRTNLHVSATNSATSL